MMLWCMPMWRDHQETGVSRTNGMGPNRWWQEEWEEERNRDASMGHPWWRRGRAPKTLALEEGKCL